MYKYFYQRASLKDFYGTWGNISPLENVQLGDLVKAGVNDSTQNHRYSPWKWEVHRYLHNRQRWMLFNKVNPNFYDNLCVRVHSKHCDPNKICLVEYPPPHTKSDQPWVLTLLSCLNIQSQWTMTSHYAFGSNHPLLLSKHCELLSNRCEQLSTINPFDSPVSTSINYVQAIINQY